MRESEREREGEREVESVTFDSVQIYNGKYFYTRYTKISLFFILFFTEYLQKYYMVKEVSF